MKLPICNFDAKTGILCADCQARLRRGDITESDVRASKVLAQVANQHPELGRAAMKRASEARGSWMLEFENGDASVLRSSQSAMEGLEKAFEGKVWAVSSGGDDRRFLEEVLYPAKVLTVNTVWLPDGEKRTRVIVPARRNERRFGDFDQLREAVKQARGIELLVETEREAGLRRP